MRFCLLLSAFCIPVCPAAHAQWLEKTIPLPSSQSPYDACLNTANNCVYVCGWSSDTVSVINADSAQVIALAAVGQRPTRVCANPDRNRIYVLNSWDNTMTIINGYNHTPIESVGLNRSAYALYCNPYASRTYSIGEDIDYPCVLTLDAYSNNPVAYLGMPKWPSAWCVNTTNSKSYIMAGETTVVISRDEIVTRLRSPVHAGGVMCYNPRRNRVYIADGSDGCLDVVDCATDSIVARSSIGPGVTFACYVPRFDLACFPNFDGSITVYDCASDSIVSRVNAERPIGVSVCDSIAGKVYTLGGDRVYVFDIAADTFVASINVGARPCQLVWSAASRRVFVVNRDGNSVSVIRDTAVLGVGEERTKDEGGWMNAGPTILSGSMVHSLASRAFFDAVGRRVLNPRPGVYFVREGLGARGQGLGRIRKVVIQR